MTGFKEQVLKERAERLAACNGEDVSALQGLEVVIFLLGAERYAIETSYVKEIWPIKNLTAIPGAPSCVLGVINVRRRIYSVIELRALFGVPVPNVPSGKALIIEKGALNFGILVDEIAETTMIDPTTLQVGLASFDSVQEEFFKGISSEGVIVLDGDKLVHSSMIIAKGK